MFVNLNTGHAAQDFKVVMTDNTGLAAHHDFQRITISRIHGLMLILSLGSEL